ncbi:MAG TPA: flagellar hook-associated protein FlgL [Oligoflexus sp.]|uniref:flagellar hook-associated protein FlgL n=1 Tax=Oligoflexus sp. TaxID=1971216 RepID=UPI002D80C736|nr:flagellar hook-associated protein FlgL [Oligoflexus sp.]HET9240478.1 flagellar hook-associated protein FlgL [Oligoflexus sp.]
MRISDRQRYALANSRVDTAKSDNTVMLEQLSTQKRINRVSDDPIGMGQALKRKTQINNYDQFIKNIEFSKGFLERTEASLQGITENLMRAKELSVSLANSTYGPSSREAAALEIREMIEGVVSLANSTYGNRYLFGGFRTQTPPVSREGGFMGDDGAIFLQIDDGTFRQVNLQARNLFEPSADEREDGHFGMIHTLQILNDALNVNDIQGIQKAMEELDFQLDKTTSYQATLGAIYNAIDETSKKLELNRELTQSDLSRIEDADTYKVTSDFKKTESVLQSTLMASNKLLQPSLMNFLQ